MPSGRCVHHGLGPSLFDSSISCHIGGIQITEQAKQVGGGRSKKGSGCQLHLVSQSKERPKSTHTEVSLLSLFLSQSASLFTCLSF